jgi:hypothetical protein
MDNVEHAKRKPVYSVPGGWKPVYSVPGGWKPVYSVPGDENYLKKLVPYFETGLQCINKSKAKLSSKCWPHV